MIRYWYPAEDDLGAVGLNAKIDDDSLSWWAGVQKCAATIALTAVAALAATSTLQAQAVFSQDEGIVAPLAKGQMEEEIWNVGKPWPIPPLVLASSDDDVFVPNISSLDEDYWLSQLRIPQWHSATGGGPFHLLEEEYWQNPVLPIPPTNSLAGWYLQHFEQNELVPFVPLFTDEDFWQNPVASVSGYLPPLVFPADDDIFLPATFVLPPDEDFALINWQLYDQAPWNIVLFLDDGSSLPGFQPDDDVDFWQNPVVPIQQIFAPLYLPDPEEIPAGGLFGAIIFDEDFWTNPVQPVWSYPYFVFTDDDIIGPPPPPIEDEDFWQNAVAPVPATNSLLAMAYVWNTNIDDFLIIIPGVGRQGINPGMWNFPSQAITPGISS